MNRSTVLKWSLLISFLVSIIGAMLKMLSSPYAGVLLYTALVSAVVFIILALSEVWSSLRIDFVEKAMWSAGLIFAYLVAAPLYLLLGRKRVGHSV